MPRNKPPITTLKKPVVNTKSKQMDEAFMADLVVNAIMSRSQLWQQMTDRRRNLEEDCGYPNDVRAVDPWTLQKMYESEPVAARCVEFFPKECWLAEPEVYEDEDGEEETAFEEAWKELGSSLGDEDLELFDQEQSSPLWEYLERLDIQSGIGCYGVMLFGIDDGRRLNEPARFVRDKGTAARKLKYLRVLPESLAQVTQLETDAKSNRYGLPLMYKLTFADPTETKGLIGAQLNTEDVHWTRILHVADNKGASEWLGVSRMRQVWRRLLDIQKVSGAGAEGYWQSCFTILSLETHPQLGGDVNINKQSLKDMMENVRNGMRRDFTLMGMSAKTLAPTVVDPSPFVNAYVDQICIAKGFPKRKFLGSERGELASTQDDKDWNDRVKGRHRRHLIPRVVVPFVNRCLQLGLLPWPEQYYVRWPDPSNKSDAESATIALTKTQTLDTYTAGNAGSVAPPFEFLTEIMGLDDETAEQWIEAGAEHEAEQQAKAMEQQKAMIQEGIVSDPVIDQGMVGPGGKPVSQNLGPSKPKPKPVANELITILDTGEELSLNAAKKLEKLTGGRWVTTDEGNHVYIKGGKPIAGNPQVIAKMQGTDEPKKKPKKVKEPVKAKPDKPQSKDHLEKRNKELNDEMNELRKHPGFWDNDPAVAAKQKAIGAEMKEVNLGLLKHKGLNKPLAAGEKPAQANPDDKRTKVPEHGYHTTDIDFLHSIATVGLDSNSPTVSHTPAVYMNDTPHNPSELSRGTVLLKVKVPKDRDAWDDREVRDYHDQSSKKANESIGEKSAFYITGGVPSGNLEFHDHKSGKWVPLSQFDPNKHQANR